MTQLDRRTIVKSAAALWVVSAGGCATAPRPLAARERRDLFPEGVASGDPHADSVVLWTRHPSAGGEPAPLTLEVAKDDMFTKLAAQEKVAVNAAHDWTVRVLVENLEPDRVYWYRFVDADGNASRTGRTITAPAANDPRPVKFAFVSCQDLNTGALNAYRRMMFEDQRRAREEQLGFVLHLGDYIYEVIWYPDELPTRYDRRVREVARYPSTEKFSTLHIPTDLEDYRLVWKAYLSDPDLQDIRAYLPFISIWDNHEFSWRSWQSFEIFGAQTKFAPARKLAANQAWFEFQPARLEGPALLGANDFSAPITVETRDVADDEIAALAATPENAAAAGSLKAWRALRYGKNIDLIVTDLFSHRMRERSGQKEAAVFSELDFYPESVMQALDAGKAYDGGKPPETLRFGEKEAPNFAKDLPPRTMLGDAQKQWFLETLKGATATWKIWACSNGALDMRADPQNLPADLAAGWPADGGYGLFGGGDFSTALSERAEIYDFVRDNGIANFALVSGDRHSFWAGLAAPALPPAAFEPVGVAFITGSISAPGMVESLEHTLPKDAPSRGLFLADRGGEKPEPVVNLLLRHGVRSALDYSGGGDLADAIALSDPGLAPHLSFVDMGGHGFALVTASADAFDVEFVCIPRPNERNETPDGGPLSYRVRHTAKSWAHGGAPALRAEIIEGAAPLSMA
jgi:alkaline phosphatase D